MRTLGRTGAAARLCILAVVAVALASLSALPSHGASPERSPFPPRRIAPVPPTPAPLDQIAPKQEIEDLGEGRYQIGAITVDKARQRFSVPGRVLKPGAPAEALEFVIIAKDGSKAHASAVMVDTDALAFNVACILIGLDSNVATEPQQHSDSQTADGDPVSVTVSWQVKGRTVTKPISALLRVPENEPVSDEWVYTGSYFLPNGSYAAQSVGTLVGFVHDRDSIIQHRNGLGLGRKGAIAYGGPEVPPVGAHVMVSVAKRTG